MRTESEIRERLTQLLQWNKDELEEQRNERMLDQRSFGLDDRISNRGGIINGLCWALGYAGTIDFLESEVRAGRASLGADLDAKIRAKS